jgi:hypothetical protein
LNSDHSTLGQDLSTEAKFLVIKFEFGGSFGMSLEGDCREVEVTPNLEFLVTLGTSLEGACHEIYSSFGCPH